MLQSVITRMAQTRSRWQRVLANYCASLQPAPSRRIIRSSIKATGDNRAIWALGVRNPFTFSFQPGIGRMFINDVGENTWEEINDGIAGSNYGWPNCEGFCNPPNPNFRDPIFAYQNDP